MKSRYQIMPPLDGDKMEALVDDIRANGIVHPIVIDEHGDVIDGHNRQAIAESLGLECPTQVAAGLTDDQKRRMAVRLNMLRRELTREQRDELIVQLRRDGWTQSDIAECVGVSQARVAQLIKANKFDQPERVQGKDGKFRPSTYQRRSEPEPDLNDEAPFAPGEADAIFDELEDKGLTPDELERAIDDNLDSKRLPESAPEWKPSKPDLGGGVSHPARYSSELIPIFTELLRTYAPGKRVLDPFAGTGRIHDLYPEFETVGIEIEPEWADLHPRTHLGNALELPFEPDHFDAVVTSPTYGNRLADSHQASDPEYRRSYTHDLGRDLTPENSGAMHWRSHQQSTEYRTFHEQAWDEAVLVLKPGGVFILNFKDHWRNGRLEIPGNWHCWLLGRFGLDFIDSLTVATGSLRQGANGELRSVEEIYVFRKTT